MTKNNYIAIRKVGKFYQTFDEDANIMHYLFGDKIINYRVGFPCNALNKVINELEEKKISYKVVEEENPLEMDFKDLNKYDEYVSRSADKLEIEKKIKHIDIELSELSGKQLLNVLNGIEKVVENEK